MNVSRYPTKIDDVAEIVDLWRFEMLAGSVVARDVIVWNTVSAAIEDLKERIKKLVGEPESAT
ncbi:hypothetical protein [Methylocapsa acidiphila]|uniref:hypothetical protein n=1 Tax=Methylocapsa acidiphila TaxID=133552 RepID=UPI00047BBE76|nr:hypothetical protein [Methylocapsa acidiphila]